MKLQHFIILDDATRGVQRQVDFETPGGVNPIADMMTMGQAYNIGIGILGHSLSTLSEIVRQQAAVYITTGLPTENTRIVNDMFGTTFEQAEKIRALKINEFVMFNSELHNKPVLATFEQLKIPGILDEITRKEKVAAFLKQVMTKEGLPLSAFQPQTKATTPSIAISAIEKQMLIFCATGRPLTITQVYSTMGVNRVQGRNVAKKLESLGFIKPHTFSTSRTGGKLCFPEVTKLGWAILEEDGFKREKYLTDGGWEHNLCAKLIRQWGIDKKLRIVFEVYLPGITAMRADGKLLDKAGQSILFNIGISSPKREAQSIWKFCQLPISSESKFMLVARDGAFRKEVIKHLKILSIDKKIVEIKLLADFVEVK